MQALKTPAGIIPMFDDLSDLADHATVNADRAKESDRFAGGSLIQAVKFMREGDLSRVKSSNQLLDKFESLAFPTPARAWSDDVCGSIPNVPAFIAGHPLAMRRRIRQDNTAAPITVFVDLFASASFNHKQIERRGAAALALVRILSARRPVELYLGFSTANNKNELVCPIVKIDTAPLDLARGAFALVSPMFLRRPMFVAAYTHGGGGSLPAYQGDLKAALAPIFSGSHLLICPRMFGNKQTPTDAWVNPAAFIDKAIQEAAPELIEAA